MTRSFGVPPDDLSPTGCSEDVRFGVPLLVGLAGIEPATSALSVLRSNRLSYSPGVENS